MKVFTVNLIVILHTSIERIFTLEKLLAQNKHYISNLSDLNGIRSCNHLVGKQTLTHLAKLDKMVVDSFKDPLADKLISDTAPFPSKAFLDVQAMPD